VPADCKVNAVDAGLVSVVIVCVPVKVCAANVAKVELVVGNVRVVVPLTAGALNVTEPLVSPEITTDAIYIL
jgi:hypothetical protein